MISEQVWRKYGCVRLRRHSDVLPAGSGNRSRSNFSIHECVCVVAPNHQGFDENLAIGRYNRRVAGWFPNEARSVEYFGRLSRNPALWDQRRQHTRGVFISRNLGGVAGLPGRYPVRYTVGQLDNELYRALSPTSIFNTNSIQ